MTPNQLLDFATVEFVRRDLTQAGDADRFFGEFGIGNIAEHPVTPHERFEYYRDLLVRLRASDRRKFEEIHKGTPLYFLAWLAFDLHRFESALQFLDASIEEDKRKDHAAWHTKPGAQFVLLNTPVQAARRTAEMLRARVEMELDRFQRQYAIRFTLDDFLRRFAEPTLLNGRFGIVAAFYVFLLEFDDRIVEIGLRSSAVLGSYQPLFLHLFKGGILLETLLKYTFPHRLHDQLGTILQGPEFKNAVGFNPPSIRIVPLPQLCADAVSSTPEAAFQAAGRLRNTTGHNLILEPLPTLPADYISLVHQELNAFLFAITRLFP
jgi:hypothetical protein